MNSIKLAPLLLTFAEVAKEMSFTKAAKKLGSSKSTVSQQVKKLEQELGMVLLVRNTRGLTLTNLGETLLARSTLLSEQLANAVQDINLNKRQPAGAFKISVPPFFERNIIVPALKQLCLEFPLLKPELIITGKWQDLIEHELDIAIFGGDLKDCNYKAKPIGKVKDIFCASPHYLAHSGVPDTVQSLSSHKYIATPWQPPTLTYVNQGSKQKEQVTLDAYAQTNNVNTLLEMTLGGLGIGLIPEFMAKPEMAKGNLQQVLTNCSGRDWHFYYLHRYHNEKPPHIDRFHQLVQHYFINLSHW